MYLKQLEMQGFKSFPDKIKLEFGNGITAVVGPNGSGKSNISDAVRWVLGEQSTKSLRGSKMEDVIFSGTKDRRPQGFAEVTLTLDNSDSALNNPEKEVRVTRRYFRSGDSAYLINGSTVRLKDVHELFMDTGLGRDGYSMVGQGRIEEMVSAKSENRRDMLEEAAGISAFRYRRADALKRLEQSEENLVRLRDIVSELSSRIGPLEKQSIKAQQFLLYAAEKKELEIGLWVNILSRSAQDIKQQAHRIEIARSQYDTAGEEIAALSQSIDEATLGTREINVKMEQMRNNRSHLEEQAAALDSQALVYENSIKHNSETVQRLTRELENGENEDVDILNEIANAQKAIEKINAKISEEKESVEELTEKLAGLKKSDETYSEEYNAVNKKLSEIMLELSQTDIMITASSSSCTEIGNRVNELEELKKSKLEKLQESEENEKALAEQIKAAAERLSELENVLAGYELRMAKAEEKAEKRKKENDELKLTLLSKESRLKFLEDTEKNMDGYQGSVKAVLKDFSRGLLTGIKGTVSNIIGVDEKYQTAIETALGNAVQDIVTETETDAKKAINMLKKTSAGRATFLPMSSIRGRVLEEKGLDGQYGFVDLAYKLVDNAPEYDEIIKSLLGRIAVCEDLDCAVDIAKKYNYKFKIVTLDGQVVNAGGSMTGGAKISNSGFLARKNEIEKIKRECDELAQKVSQSFSEMKSAAQNVSAQKAELEGGRGDLLRLQEEKIRLDGEYSVGRSRTQTLKSDIENCEKELTGCKERISYFGENISIAQKRKSEIEEEKKANELALASLTGGRDSLMKQREELNAEMSEINMRIVSLVKEEEAKKETVASLNRRKEQSTERKDSLKEEIRLTEEKNSRLLTDAESVRASAQNIREAIADGEKETRRLIAQREELEKSVSDSRMLEKTKTEEREKISGELIRLEEKKAYLEKEQQDIERKLFEEYALTKREAAEQSKEIESVPKAQKRLSELKGQIKALGSVNVSAIEEYKEVSSRYEFLSEQVNDAEKSKKELLKMIDELTEKMAELFKDRFEAINSGFKETFTALFGGGTAELVLEDENDILECNIEIKAQPPGKNVKSMTLLSGGEKGLTAIALLFAILKVRPAPFCIFDEVEAALDDVNVLRYAQYVRMMTDRTQFILITHRRGTMEEADMLYGVTMQEHGVSKLLELKTAEMAEKLKLEE